MKFEFEVDSIEEVWKDAFGYEGIYEVSNLGRIRSLDREVWNGTNYHTKSGRILNTFKKPDGYVVTQLTKDGISKTVSMHRLVALTFLPKIENKDFVDHINTVRDDNRVINLRWVTRSENHMNDITRRKRSDLALGSNNPNSKKVICLNTGEVFEYIKDAAKKYNINSPSNITSCCKGRVKTVGRDVVTNEGLVWMYLDDYEKMTDKDVSKIMNDSKPSYASSSVVCKNTGEVFKSIKDAADKYSINEASIRAVCTEKNKTTGNGLNLNERLSWEYINKRGDR